MTAHVFVDNSNVWIGAGIKRTEIEPAVPHFLFRIYFRNFFQLIESNYEIGMREIAGSLPPESEDLWDVARNLGYNTNLLYRVDDGSKTREQSVDEALHLKIANAVIDYETPQTLIVVTGDGAISNLGTSFKGQIERALKRGWSVDLWSWDSTRNRNYDELVGMYQNRFRLKSLDPYYNQISFVKEAIYTDLDGKQRYASERVVSRLSA